MKATVHYWTADDREYELTLETQESEQFTKDAAVEIVPTSAHIEHVEVTE